MSSNDPPVTDAELAEIERLDREATPPPWSDGDHEAEDDHTVYDASDEQRGAVAVCCLNAEDSTFIARARTLLPRVAVELRDHRRPVDVEAAIEKMARALYDGTGRGERGFWLELLGWERQEYRAIVRPHVERAAVLAREAEGLRASLTQRTAERDEARAWVRRLTATERVLTCAFCGETYPPGTPDSNDPALVAHVKVCEKHPLRAELAAARAEIERLKKERDVALGVLDVAEGLAETPAEDVGPAFVLRPAEGERYPLTIGIGPTPLTAELIDAATDEIQGLLRALFDPRALVACAWWVIGPRAGEVVGGRTTVDIDAATLRSHGMLPGEG